MSNKLIILYSVILAITINNRIVDAHEVKSSVYEAVTYNPSGFTHDECYVPNYVLVKDPESGETYYEDSMQPASTYTRVNIQYAQFTQLDNKEKQEVINRYIRYKSRVNQIPDLTSVESTFQVTSQREDGYIGFLFNSTYMGCQRANSTTVQHTAHVNYKRGLTYHLADLFRYDYEPVLIKLARCAYKQKFPDGTCEDCVSLYNNLGFSFDENNFYLHYSQYELASGAAGIVDLIIPLDELQYYIDPDGPILYKETNAYGI